MSETAGPGSAGPPTYVNYPLERAAAPAPTYEPTPPPYGGPVEEWTPGAVPDRARGESPVERLVDPPRQVPAAMWLGVAAFSPWELFTILITLVSPIALWIFYPILLPFACAAVLLVGGYRRVRQSRRLRELARWGKVATVLDVEHGYGATSFQNVPLPQAVGWKVTRSSYSGQSHTSTIRYSVDETTGTMKLRGRPYAGGVILADPRRQDEALCVSSFPWAMRPDDSGELTARLGPWALIGVLVTVVVYLGLAAGAVLTLAVFA